MKKNDEKKQEKKPDTEQEKKKKSFTYHGRRKKSVSVDHGGFSQQGKNTYVWSYEVSEKLLGGTSDTLSA